MHSAKANVSPLHDVQDGWKGNGIGRSPVALDPRKAAVAGGGPRGLAAAGGVPSLAADVGLACGEVQARPAEAKPCQGP